MAGSPACVMHRVEEEKAFVKMSLDCCKYRQRGRLAETQIRCDRHSEFPLVGQVVAGKALSDRRVGCLFQWHGDTNTNEGPVINLPSSLPIEDSIDGKIFPFGACWPCLWGRARSVLVRYQGWF